MLKKGFCSETRCAQTAAQKPFFAYGTLFSESKIGIALRSALIGKLLITYDTEVFLSKIFDIFSVSFYLCQSSVTEVVDTAQNYEKNNSCQWQTPFK